MFVKPLVISPINLGVSGRRYRLREPTSIQLRWKNEPELK